MSATTLFAVLLVSSSSFALIWFLTSPRLGLTRWPVFQREYPLNFVYPGDRSDMFLPRDEILELLALVLELRPADSGSALPLRPYPGWSILQVLNALDREGVTTRGSADVADCEGVWLRPSGYVLLVPSGEDPDAVFGAAIRAESDGRRSSHIYLSRQEVFDLAHHSFYIAVNHGYNRRHVERHHSGWSWDELYGTLKRSGLLRREEGETTARHLPDGAVGVLIGRDGSTRVEYEETSRSSEWLSSAD